MRKCYYYFFITESETLADMNLLLVASPSLTEVSRGDGEELTGEEKISEKYHNIE